ncbi:P-loop containing nucleoside triphosphate hydrolase protein [Haematococcus lacustris]
MPAGALLLDTSYIATALRVALSWPRSNTPLARMCVWCRLVCKSGLAPGLTITPLQSWRIVALHTVAYTSVMQAGSEGRRTGLHCERRHAPFLRHPPRCVRLRAQPSKRGDVLLIADDLGKTYDGEKQLFSSLTFSVVAGEKLAVVGPNGTGKSTLLKLVAGIETHDTGTLTRNKGATVGYLPQDPPLPQGATVLQAVLQSDSVVARTVQQYQQALAASEAASGKVTKELEVAIERMNTYNAWELDSEAKRVLEAVGLGEQLLATQVSALSGGQRKRVALAAALLGKPDLLILDEPTNHMDVEMIRWMERELRRDDLAVVLVSHDRFFMEAVCDRMLELDRGRCYMHRFGGPGSFLQFKEAREFRRASQASAAADARVLFKREAEWIVRQPKARQAKSQARVKAFQELVERVRDTPQADLKVDFNTSAMARQGNKVVRLERVGFQVQGKTIIKDFTYDLGPGERLGIVGPNGAGKSTLLNLIAGSLQPTSGRRESGETTAVGYFTQYPPDVREDMRVMDYLREVVEERKVPGGAIEGVAETPEVMLEKLGFARPRQYQRVGLLSGGERRRLHLASVLLGRPNLLILDEPTNDLDLATVEVVEELVRSYRGALLVVSHDRAFMDNVAERLLVLKGDGLVRLFEGSYGEYLETMDQERAEAEAMRQLELEEAREKLMAATGSRQPADSPQAPPSSSPSSSPSSTAGVKDTGQPSSSKAASANGTGPGKAGGGGTVTVLAPPPPAAAKKARKMGYYEQQEYARLCAAMDSLGAKRDALQERVMELAQSGSDISELERASMEMGRVCEEIDGMSERWLELAELAGDL